MRMQATWLVGDLARDANELGSFLAAGGARSLVGAFSAQLSAALEAAAAVEAATAAAAGSSSGNRMRRAALRAAEDRAASAAAAIAQAIVAMCCVAEDADGAAALVTAGACGLPMCNKQEISRHPLAASSSAGAIPPVVLAIERHADTDIAVAEAGPRAVDFLLRQPFDDAVVAAARLSFVTCGGAPCLVKLLRST